MWGWAGGGKCPCGLKNVVLRLKLTAIKRRNLSLWPKRGVVFFPNQRYRYAFALWARLCLRGHSGGYDGAARAQITLSCWGRSGVQHRRL